MPNFLAEKFYPDYGNVFEQSLKAAIFNLMSSETRTFDRYPFKIRVVMVRAGGGDYLSRLI